MLKPGMIISDRYEIIDKVGSGGMADVYKARDQRLNRFVAIKVLKPEYSSDKSFVNKFRAEAQSAAGLSHPNIVNVYDVGDDSGLHYIVMELVEGITLKRFIERKGKLDIKEASGSVFRLPRVWKQRMTII
jgi:serine/threonine-protein kinase